MPCERVRRSKTRQTLTNDWGRCRRATLPVWKTNLFSLHSRIVTATRKEEDEQKVASFCSAAFQSDWIKFAVRGFDATQTLLVFLRLYFGSRRLPLDCFAIPGNIVAGKTLARKVFRRVKTRRVPILLKGPLPSPGRAGAGPTQSGKDW